MAQQIVAFDAQGYPVVDPKKSMIYQSDQILKQHSDKYRAYKTQHHLPYEASNNTSCCGSLDEVFGPPLNSSPEATTSWESQVMHPNLIAAFEQASNNIENLGQTRPQANPTSNTVPIFRFNILKSSNELKTSASTPNALKTGFSSANTLKNSASSANALKTNSVVRSNI